MAALLVRACSFGVVRAKGISLHAPFAARGGETTRTHESGQPVESTEPIVIIRHTDAEKLAHIVAVARAFGATVVSDTAHAEDSAA